MSKLESRSHQAQAGLCQARVEFGLTNEERPRIFRMVQEISK
jgi:hypothetical protein